MVLVGVLHKMGDNTACGSKEGPVAVHYPSCGDFCVQDLTCLCLPQQEALDVLLDDDDAVLGGNHALVEAELLAGAVVVAKEKKHSVHFANLVRLVHGLVCLTDQLQEAKEGDKVVPLHDFIGVHEKKLWAAPFQ